MFHGPSAQLKEEFSQHFKNVSRIMDCVGCEKCRMWGKLQTTGLGAAMKILFSSHGTSLHLRRNEIVSFFVTYGRYVCLPPVVVHCLQICASTAGTGHVSAAQARQQTQNRVVTFTIES